MRVCSGVRSGFVLGEEQNLMGASPRVAPPRPHPRRWGGKLTKVDETILSQECETPRAALKFFHFLIEFSPFGLIIDYCRIFWRYMSGIFLLLSRKNGE